MHFRLPVLLLTVVLFLAGCTQPNAGPLTPEPSPSSSVVTTSHDAAALGESFTVSVQLHDAKGDPLRQAGHPITFVATSGNLQPASTAASTGSTETVETNQIGSAAVTFTPASSGTVTIRAYFGTSSAGAPIGSVTVTVTNSTVELDDLSVTYDGQPKPLSPRFYPPAASVGATITYSMDGRELDGAPSAAGEYAVTVTPGNGYSGAATATLTITPRDLTVSNVVWNDKSYDASASATALGAVLATTAVIEGDDVRLADTLTAQFASAAVGTHGVVASFTLAGDDASNYRVFPQPTGTATITAAELTLPGATVATKEYDGNRIATIDGGLTSDDVHGEDVSLIGTFATASVGAGIEVTVRLAGEAAANYALTATTLTGDITPRALELLPNPITLTFGAALPTVVSFTATGLVEGESVASVELAVVGSAAPYAPGTHALQVTNPVAASGTNLTNYAINTPAVPAGLTVVEGLVTITPTGPFTKTYGAADPDFAYTVTGADLDGNLVVNREPGEDVGSYDFVLGDTSAWPQYQFAIGASTAFQVQPAIATVVPAAGQGKTYGAADPALAFSISGLQFGDIAAGTLARAQGDNVGQYAFDISGVSVNDGASGANYTLELASDAAVFQIEAATLSIAPSTGQTKLIGAADPVFTFSAAGFVNGDTEAIMTGALSRAAGEAAGTYAYTLGNLTAGSNYDLSLVGDAVFSIGAASLAGATVTYDGQPHALTASFEPAEAAVGATIAYFDAAGNALAGAPTNAGAYTVTAAAGPGYAGNAAASLVIQPRALTVTDVEFANKIYDAATGATLSATLVTTNVVTGDDVSLTERLVGTFASSQVGEHAVAGNIELRGADASNYFVSPQPTGTANITLRNVSLQGGVAADKTYDGNNQASITGSLNGVRAADATTIGLAATFNQTGVGNDIDVNVELTGVAASNYALVNPNLAADITQRALTVIIADLEPKTFGDQLTLGAATSGFAAAGLVTGESITELTLASEGAEERAETGTYAVTATGPQGDNFNPTNYAITYNNGSLQVTPREVTLAGAKTTWGYGDAPEAGDLTPVVTSGSLPHFASLSGSLNRTGLNVDDSATFAQGTVDIVNSELASLLDNFSITYAAYEITARPATITVDYDQAKTYGYAIDLSTVDDDYFTATGLAVGDTIDQVTLSSAGFPANAPVATYEVVASLPTGTSFDAANYDLTYLPGALEVTPRELTLSGTFAIDQRPFDGSTDAPVASPHGLVLENLAEGDDVQIVPAAAFADGNVGGDKTAVLTSTSVLTGADAHNYSLSLADAPQSQGAIVKATVEFDVTIAGTGNAKQVTYNGSTTFQPNVTSSVQPYPADQPVAFIIDIHYGNATGPSRGSFHDVGTYTVIVTADDPRYEGQSSHTDLEVLAREIIIASENSTKVFGDPNPALNPAIDASSTYNLGAGDAFSIDSQLDYAGSEDQYLDAGSYSLNLGDVTIRRAGNNVTSNYSITFATDFEITSRTLTVTPTTQQAKVYGETDPALEYAVTGLVGEDDETLLTGTLTRVAGEDVGLYSFVLGTLSAGHNYLLALEDDATTFEITARPLTLTATTTSITYGDTPADLTALVAADSTSLRDGDTLSGSLTMPTPTAGTHVFGAGDAHITRGETDLTSNYAITYDTYAVTQRAATIVPNSGQSKTYGEADATLEFSTEGILEGDTISGVLARVEGEDVGSYAFALGTLTNANYALALTSEPATYAITPRSITLGATTPSKEYGDIDPNLAPVLLNDTTLRAGDALTGELAHDGVNANPAYALTIGSVKVMRDAVEVTSNYDITFGTFAIEPKPVSFAITNSDFVIGTEAGMAHVFRGDGVSQIRGLEVASDPSNMNSFRFTYRRTHDQNNNPVPSGQQTVQNINLLGSYIVTVIANDPNYVGQTPLSVWVTDVSEIVFLDVTPDEVVLGGTTSISVELRNANGDPRPAGPAGLTIDLSTAGADVTLRDASDNHTITSLTIAAGASSATALIRPLAAGAVTVTATPETTPASGFSPVDLSFTAVEPVLTANNDGPYEVVAGGSVQIAISELLENDSWTGVTTWGFDQVVSTSGVTAGTAGNNLVVSADPTAGNTTGTVTYRIRSAGDFGQTTTATVTVSVKLPPVEALLFTDRDELIEFMGTPYVLPTFETVFNSWPRFENNSYYAAPNGSGGAWTGNLADWSYNSEEQRIEFGTNSGSHIGIVSDEKFEYFDFEATLQSSNTDDDSIGLVIAFTRVNGVNKALIAHRTQGGMNPTGGWGISYLDGSTLTVLQNVSIGGTSGRWDGNSSRVRIQRTGDIIRTSTTPWNTPTNFQGEFTIDLDANTINGQGFSQDLSVFKGKQQYGYYVQSQANTTYVDIEFTGGVALDTAILLTNYDSSDNYWTGSEVYKFDVDGWGGEPVIGATIQTELGYPRTVTSVATESSVNGDSFEIFENRVKAHNLPD